MYKLIQDLLSPKLKEKLLLKLKSDSDPLKLYKYIDSIIDEIPQVKKLSQDAISDIDRKCTRKMFRGGSAPPHPSQYANPSNYFENPASMGIEMSNIDWDQGIARSGFEGITGGCLATPLFNEIQKYLRAKLKGKKISTSAITSVGGMITHRIMYGINQVNKKNRLASFTLLKM